MTNAERQQVAGQIAYPVVIGSALPAARPQWLPEPFWCEVGAHRRRDRGAIVIAASVLPNSARSLAAATVKMAP